MRCYRPIKYICDYSLSFCTENLYRGKKATWNLNILKGTKCIPVVLVCMFLGGMDISGTTKLTLTKQLTFEKQVVCK